MGPINIQSQECRNLLDIIDKLRSQGVDRYVALPQIIVCGDQSSGKSSVLEAISGLSFPTKDNLCTRFATELVLRRNPTQRVDVSIVPHHSRSTAEKSRLQAFTATINEKELDVGPVIEKAKVAMGLGDGSDKTDMMDEAGVGLTNGLANSITTAPSTRRFSNDVLRIELSGPTQPHLTLVDLPGLFQAGNAEQSADEAPVVKQLVLDYMRRPRSVILAVVSAAYDFANQAVTQHARELDPLGARTMGLITKPDKLDRGSDTERSFVRMACNNDVTLRLGWHVLKNRGHEMRGASSDARDAAEAAFFAESDSPWAAVDPSHLGIGPLRPRLSNVLQDQILTQLPMLRADIDALIAECNRGLARLGAPRANTHNQRRYLTGVSAAFSELMHSAVDGSYVDTAFFGRVTGADGDANGHGDKKADGSRSSGYERRLRAVVQNMLTNFADDMHRRGMTRKIVEDGVEMATTDGITYITREAYVDEVKALLAEWRGCELPGLYNPLVVGDLFRAQARGWTRLTDACVNRIMQATFATITAALHHTAVNEVADKLLQTYINPAMETLRRDVNETIAKLHAQMDIHPITLNHYFTDNVQAVRDARRAAWLEKQMYAATSNTPGSTVAATRLLVHLKANKPDSDMQRLAAFDAIDYMEAYYKVALKRYIDDVAVLAIEQCLISKLPSLFNPDALYEITDDDIAALCSEKPAAVTERARLTEKIATLEHGLAELRRLDKHRRSTFDADVTSRIGDDGVPKVGDVNWVQI